MYLDAARTIIILSVSKSFFHAAIRTETSKTKTRLCPVWRVWKLQHALSVITRCNLQQIHCSYIPLPFVHKCGEVWVPQATKLLDF